MLPADDRRGDVPPVSTPGDWVMMISAPWSTRALAVSRKLSLWLSICLVGKEGETDPRSQGQNPGPDNVHLISPPSTLPISLDLFPAFIVLFNKYFNLTLKFLTVKVNVKLRYHDIPSSRHVAGIVQGADLGVSLIFEIQLHVLDTNVSSPWENNREP